MNQLLQSVITDSAMRNEQLLPAIAAQAADSYLPWSDES